MKKYEIPTVIFTFDMMHGQNFDTRKEKKRKKKEPRETKHVREKKTTSDGIFLTDTQARKKTKKTTTQVRQKRDKKHHSLRETTLCLPH